MTRGEAEERAAAREVYAMGDGIPRVNGLDFSQDAAARRAGINPAGLPTYVGSDDPAIAYDYRNGSDIASDNYNGSRRTATVRGGQGPLAAMADLGLNSAQQQAGYGYLLKTGQVQIGRNGVPMVQPGQELHIDLDDMSQAGLAGRAINRENSMRADRLADAAQAATYYNENYGNEGRSYARATPAMTANGIYAEDLQTLNAAFDRREAGQAAVRDFVGPPQIFPRGTDSIMASPERGLGTQLAGALLGSPAAFVRQAWGDAPLNPITGEYENFNGPDRKAMALMGILPLPAAKAGQGARLAEELVVSLENSGNRYLGLLNRNAEPLTATQIQDARAYAQKLGLPDDRLQFFSNGGAHQRSAYSDLFDTVFVGPDLLPGSGSKLAANSRVSANGLLAHEIVGHRETTLAGKAFEAGSLNDEVQASWRAARLAPDLTGAERFTLLRDAVERVHAADMRVRNLDKSQFWFGRP